MVNETRNQEPNWTAVIARSLAYLCVHGTDLRQAELAPKATLLESFGIPRGDVATLLDTTADTIRVTLAKAKKRKKGRKSKSKAKVKGRG